MIDGAAEHDAARPLYLWPRRGELLNDGCKVSLSIDHNTTYNCDLFVAMRILYALHQHRLGGKIKLTTRRLIELATIEGARDLGIADKVGSPVGW